MHARLRAKKEREKSVPYISVDDRLLTSVSLDPISSKNHEASRSTSERGRDERRKTEGLPDTVEGRPEGQIKAGDDGEEISAEDRASNTGIDDGDPGGEDAPLIFGLSSAPGFPL